MLAGETAPTEMSRSAYSERFRARQGSHAAIVRRFGTQNSRKTFIVVNDRQVDKWNEEMETYRHYEANDCYIIIAHMF